MIIRLFRAWAYLIVYLLPLAVGTEVCMECRPLKLQRAPGLGIELGMSYGTASIQIRNETIINIVKIPGSEEYVAAMKAFALDALRVRKGAKSSLSAIKYEPAKNLSFAELVSNPTISNVRKYFTQRLYYSYPSLDPNPPKLDPWIEAISNMLSSLKRVVWANIPLSENSIILSIPDCEVDTGHIYKYIFQMAAEEAGLKLMRPVRPTSGMALEAFNIIDCEESSPKPEPFCPSGKRERLDVILGVSYSEFSLGITLLTRHWGSLWPKRVSETIELGYGAPLRSRAPDQYWHDVKILLTDAMEGESVDRVLLLGSHGDDNELRKTVTATLEEYNDGGVIEISGGTAEECIFTTARGAAIVARVGMRFGFDACLIPDRCEIDDPDGDWSVIDGNEDDGKEVQERKSEL